MVGVLEISERDRRALLGFFCLLIGDGSDEFGGEAVTTSDLPGDLRLIHRLRSVKASEKDEQISKCECYEDSEEQAPADQDTGVELGSFFIHAGGLDRVLGGKLKALVP